MANRLYINAVQLRYLRAQPGAATEFYGFIVGDDYDQYEVLDLPTEAEIPGTLEGVLRHCNDHQHTAVLVLLAQHASADKGVTLDGDYADVAELKRLMKVIAEEEEE